MDRQAEVKCSWCQMDVSAEAWNAPGEPRPITHEMVHAFMQAFPEIEPASYADLEPQDYLAKDVYFSLTEWPIFDLWAVQQGYWTIDAALAKAVAHDKDAKQRHEARAALRHGRDRLAEDELPF